MKWLSLVGPLEGLGHGAVEIFDERQHLASEVLNGAEVAATEEFANQDAEPDLHLIHPRGMLRGVVEDDRMAGLSQERRARGSRAQDATDVFDPEVLSDPVLVGDVAHQAL